MSAQEQNSLTIGRVAKQADVTIDTIRFYERRGLLPKPQRAANGYRLYPPNTIARLHFIRRAKGLGFTLDEIRALLKLQDAGGTKADVKALTNRKLEQIDIKITDLQLMRDALRKPELMQFAQRIGVDYHLEPLGAIETCGYIQHRLVTAGAERNVFTPSACERIHS